MPFSPQTQRPYTRANIENIVPDQMGVYGILTNETWVYVGSGDIRARMLDHVNGDNDCITKKNPTHWVAELAADYISREKELIVELNPECNKQVG